MKKGPQTPKGFRDILPPLAKKRRGVVNIIADVLEDFGFVPLETPTVEFAETLLGKYGEEERLIYQFQDRGGRELALRFDLTVPLARFVANNLGLIQGEPFRRYQVGQVFRGEKPQKGRWREFTQFDFDTVGSDSESEDANVVIAALKACDAIGLKDSVMLVNDRNVFKELTAEGVVSDAELPQVLRSLDKLEKIGKDGFVKELVEKGIPETRANAILNNIDALKKALNNSKYIPKILERAKEEGIDNKRIALYPQLARGLDYYTSTIFELRANNTPNQQSLGGGGRYDELIGMFAGKKIPAVGFSFGLDRLVEIVDN